MSAAVTLAWRGMAGPGDPFRVADHELCQYVVGPIGNGFWFAHHRVSMKAYTESSRPMLAVESAMAACQHHANTGAWPA